MSIINSTIAMTLIITDEIPSISLLLNTIITENISHIMMSINIAVPIRDIPKSVR